MSAAKNEPCVDMGFTSERFPPGIHMCLIYQDEVERLEIIEKYLESGFKTGEQVFYFPDTMRPEEVNDWLKEMGIHIKTTEAENRMIIQNALSAYCPSGAFVPETMYKKLKNAYLAARKSGFSNVRISGEMSWAVRNISGTERLMEYEANVNHLVVQYPFTAICQYDVNLFDGLTIFNVLNVHPMMIIHGQIVRNPYYMAPDDFLAGRRV